jgi:anaphase-promoting complex subunit 2
MGWLTKIYSSSDVIQNVDASLAKFRQKLKHLLYETYTRTRIEQLFNIIIGNYSFSFLAKTQVVN